MNTTDRAAWLLELDEELLTGGVILPEWCSAIVREADKAFTAEAFLGSLLTSVAGVETFLRSESSRTKQRLVDLIDESELPEDVRRRLHEIRRYRNKWVHVDEPWEDQELLAHPQVIEAELEIRAVEAIRLLREVIYSNQWV